MKGRIYLNGVVVVDKPSGMTSYDVLRAIKRWLPGGKVGYLGTLDPLATGVLPLLLGEGTKLAPFLESGTKAYEAVVYLGVITDTYDRDGAVIKRVDIKGLNLSPQRVEEVLKGFRGRIMQTPPLYSAIKVDGEPLYRKARRGEGGELRMREVEIYKLVANKIAPPELHLYIECSKGTYIRSLAHAIGEALGSGAHVAQLRRLRNGPFTIQQALPLAEVEELLKAKRLKGKLIPLAEAIGFMPLMDVDQEEARMIRNGHSIPMAKRVGVDAGGLVRLVNRGGLVAVGKVEATAEGLMVKPVRVFADVAFTKKVGYGRNKRQRVERGGR